MNEIFEIEDAPSPELLFGILSREEGPFFLDSSMRGGEVGRWSFLGSRPFAVIASKDRRVRFEGLSMRHEQGEDVFDTLDRALGHWRLPDLGVCPFSGGAVGYISYDAARLFERLPTRACDDRDFPDLHFGFYDVLVAYDHQEGRTFGVTRGLASPLAEQRRRVEGWIESARRMAAKDSGADAPSVHEVGAEVIHPLPDLSRLAYLDAVGRIRGYIRSGDAYQVNFTQRFTTNLDILPFELYSILRKNNPAPFAAYLDTGRHQILSSSPERYLALRGRRLETRPIKGTSPRYSDPIADAASRTALGESQKDRAEHLMIVDLERNDLGRICEIGSVRVPELFKIESYATVHHLVSVIEGNLPAGVSAVDAIRATFPGGSITGAPKVRAMEIIDELEPSRRGVYTGAIGWLGFDGDMDLNIAIRTIVVSGKRVWYNVGGGVVWDSEPAAEYEESLQKGAALARTLEAASLIAARGNRL